jgi:FkbM family methyltransferase
MNTNPKLNTTEITVAESHIQLFEKLLLDRIPHESDFYFFQNFKDISTLFIDVGANIANSVLSVHFICPQWRIVSFEPNLSLNYFLQRAKSFLEVQGQEYSYFMCGLSNTEGTINFFIPKIDNWFVIGEASCIKEHFTDDVVSDRLSSYSTHGGWELVESEVEIITFDNFVKNNDIFKDETLIIVKIDVEGYEFQVLDGMKNFIQSKQPIFMIENNYSVMPDPVEEYLALFGYQKYQYFNQTNQLKLQNEHSLNSFYIPQALLPSLVTKNLIIE